MPQSKLRGFVNGKVGPKDGNDFIGSLHHYNEVGKEEFISGCNNATQSFWKNIDEICNSNC